MPSCGQAPHCCAVLFVVEDVAVDVELVLAVEDGLGFATYCPQPSRAGVAMIARPEGGVLLCQSGPVTWIVIGETCEHMQVMVVEGGDDDLKLLLLEAEDELLEDGLAEGWRDVDGGTLEELL